MKQANDLLLFGKRCKCLAIAKLAAEAPVEARRGGCKRVPKQNKTVIVILKWLPASKCEQSSIIQHLEQTHHRSKASLTLRMMGLARMTREEVTGKVVC